MIIHTPPFSPDKWMVDWWYLGITLCCCLSSLSQVRNVSIHTIKRYANAFRNTFLEFNVAFIIKLYREMRPRSCIVQFDLWSRGNVGRAPFCKSPRRYKCDYKMTLRYHLYRNPFLAQTRFRSHFFSAFQSC